MHRLFIFITSFPFSDPNIKDAEVALSAALGHFGWTVSMDERLLTYRLFQSKVGILWAQDENSVNLISNSIQFDCDRRDFYPQRKRQNEGH